MDDAEVLAEFLEVASNTEKFKDKITIFLVQNDHKVAAEVCSLKFDPI